MYSTIRVVLVCTMHAQTTRVHISGRRNTIPLCTNSVWHTIYYSALSFKNIKENSKDNIIISFCTLLLLYVGTLTHNDDVYIILL